MMGIEDTPVFIRNKVSNQAELTDMVLSAASYLDKQTILEKIPWITVDEIDGILARLDAESHGRFGPEEDDEEETEEDEETGEEEE